MVSDGEFLPAEPRRDCAAGKSPEHVPWSATEAFDHHLAWAEGAEHYDQCRRARTKQPGEPARHGSELGHTVERGKIRIGAVETLARDGLRHQLELFSPRHQGPALGP